MMEYNLRRIALAVSIVLCAVTGWAVKVNVNGINYDLVDGKARVININNDIPAEPVVTAVVKNGDTECPVVRWDERSFRVEEDNVPADRLVSLNTEDGDTPLYIRGECISGWTALRSIELPAQLSKVDCDFITQCPSLVSVTFRSPEIVTFDSPYYNNNNFSLASHPVLYVQPDLVEEYEKLKADTSADNYAHYFLGQVSEIRALGNPDVSPGAHILVGDMHLNLPDAAPGQRITVEAPEGQSIRSVKINGQDAEVPDDTRTQFTLPDFDHHMVMAVDLTSSSQSGVADALAQAPAADVRPANGAVEISGYDGSEVTVMDLSGRIVRRTHRQRIPLPSGIYIVFYHFRGHKIQLPN